MRTYFVTGATGFIGKHLVKRLTAAGDSVVTNLRLLHACRPHAVIHLAAVTHTRAAFDPKLYESNIVFARRMLSTPYRTVYASSISAAELVNPYAYTKLYNEHLGRLHGNATGLRLFNVYGPGNNKGLVKTLIDAPPGSELSLRGAEQVRDYIFIEDVVEAIVSAVDAAPGVLEVGTGVGTTTLDLIHLFTQLSGKHFTTKIVPALATDHSSSVCAAPLNDCMPLRVGLLKTINAGLSIAA